MKKQFMPLQGNKLGFLTDRDDKGGYGVQVVRECVVEALLTGISPGMNHFNIIAGNMYVTKVGFKHLLDHVKGLKYIITNELPRINKEKGSAAIIMVIKWKMGNGEWEEQKLDVAVRVNKAMGTDAVIGKAERKARAWLYNNFSISEIVDGDAEEVTFEIVEENKESTQKKADKAEDSLLEKMEKNKKEPVPPADENGELNFG
jgi:hypothetical protein